MRKCEVLTGFLVPSPGPLHIINWWPEYFPSPRCPPRVPRPAASRRQSPNWGIFSQFSMHQQAFYRDRIPSVRDILRLVVTLGHGENNWNNWTKIF